MPLVFRVTLGKTGNSLRVTLPKPIVEGFDWKEGDEIVIYVSEGEITLKKGKGADEINREKAARTQKG